VQPHNAVREASTPSWTRVYQGPPRGTRPCPSCAILPSWPPRSPSMSRTSPCPRTPARAPGCGREVGFRVEHLRHVGWELYRVESSVNWCGHAREVIPFLREDGLVA